MRDHNIFDAETMSYNEFRQKIKMQSYYIQQKTVRFGSKNDVVRCDEIDLDLLEKQGIEMPF